eukprot:2758650-Pleurochrysis_carterae.AAC.1
MARAEAITCAGLDGVGVGSAQFSHFLDESCLYHLFASAVDPAAELLPRESEEEAAHVERRAQLIQL